ncbi:tetratricopeptide repeat protein [Pseudomonas sp. KnCO4]|uniref:tetratricopeptide repeat protein n=1 Tax=Pseudomonas sp. KnCO4 TaxID=3381355 RepID=UPI00387814C9
MACRDRYSLPLSTQSEAAAERYQEGLDLLLSLWPSAAEVLEEAIVLDSAFALAHAARARLHAVKAEAAAAKAKIALASDLVQRNGTERERSHVNVLFLAIHGQSARALTAALEHIDRWPLDILILGLPLGAFGLLAFSGRPDHDQARVDLCERQSARFPQDDWWFLNYRGWAHGENGNLALGRALTQRSLELRRHNVNAVHAVAHVLYEAGASDEAEKTIANWLPEYDRSGVLHGHIAWHGALIALERGDIEVALNVYSEQVAPSASLGVPINVVSDTTSFLWRMHLYGHEVPSALWADAARYASGYFQQPGFPFADFHMAIVDAASGNQQALERRAEGLSTLVLNGALQAGEVVPVLCHAVQAFANGEYARCTRILEPLAHEVVRIGGSGAQREIAQDMLLVAMMRSGEVDKARRILDERLHRRPSPRDSRWLTELAAV